MGIAGFTTWLRKRYGNVFVRIEKRDSGNSADVSFDHVYIDMNRSNLPSLNADIVYFFKFSNFNFPTASRACAAV